MPEGPFGNIKVEGPLSNNFCTIVAYMKATGRPRENVNEKMLELEEEIRQSTPHVPLDGQTIFTNLPRDRMRSNTIELAVGYDPDLRVSPTAIETTYDDIKMKVEDVVRGDVTQGFITSGDPQEVLES